MIRWKWRSISEKSLMVSIVNEIILGLRWWEAIVGSNINMVVSVDGDFTEEEDRKGWLVTRAFIFRRRASSLEIVEA